MSFIKSKWFRSVSRRMLAMSVLAQLLEPYCVWVKWMYRVDASRRFGEALRNQMLFCVGLVFLEEVVAARSSCRVLMGARFQCECFVFYIEDGRPPDNGFRPTPNVACYYI